MRETNRGIKEEIIFTLVVCCCDDLQSGRPSISGCVVVGCQGKTQPEDCQACRELKSQNHNTALFSGLIYVYNGY